MKVKIKLKRKHPHGKMHLSKHVITSVFQEFDLNADEQKELSTVGCQHWFISEEVKKEIKKKVKKKLKKKVKKEDK